MQRHVSYQQMLYIMQMLSEKKQVMPKDMLGRSLAYTCFLPRLSNKLYLYEKLKYTTTPKKALHTDTKKLSKLIQTSSLTHDADFDEEIICVIFSSLDQVGKNEEMNSIDYLSIIRRLSPAFVIHDNVFIDEYQILESAISGADMIMLNMKYVWMYCEILYVLETNPMLLDSSIDDIAIQIPLIIQNSKINDNVLEDKLRCDIKTHIDMLITFAYNLGIIPIMCIADLSDLEMLQLLDNISYSVYATKATTKFISQEKIIFTDDQYMADKNLADILIVTK